MESDPNQMSQSPVLCRSGCGFYANAAFDGMCSMCYKESVKRKQAAPTGAPSSLVSEPISSTTTTTTTSASSSSSSSFVPSPTSTPPASSVASSPVAEDVPPTSNSEPTPAPAPKPEKKKKTRCEHCRANVGVISFPCRCGRIFCGSHRYAKEHNCTFDYKEHGAEEIRKNNPQIIGEKIQKI